MTTQSPERLKSKKRHEALKQAIVDNDIKQAKQLMKQYPRIINNRAKDGHLPLHRAINVAIEQGRND